MFTALGLLALLVGLALATPRLLGLLTRQVPGEEEGAEGPPAPGDEPAAAVQRRIDVKLFFAASGTPGLVMEDRAVAYSEEMSRQLRNVVEEIVRGSKSGHRPTLPAETRVLEVFFEEKNGTAYVSLSKEAGALHGGGSAAELTSVYSVVNSLAANFPAVKRVQILLEDKPAPTLAGHVNLLRPLHPDMTLLAGAGSPPGAPVAVPAPGAAARPASPAPPS